MEIYNILVAVVNDTDTDSVDGYNDDWEERRRIIVEWRTGR